MPQNLVELRLPSVPIPNLYFSCSLQATSPEPPLLQFAFYEGHQFPALYQDGVFVAEHGSWNRRIRSGYQVVFIPFRDGSPAGEPVPFLSGLVPDPAGKDVYGRPVGVAVDPAGSLLVSDDGQKLIWKVSYGLAGVDPRTGHP